MTVRGQRLVLALAGAVAVSGIIYELAVAALSSYLVGDSVTQFSLVIGAFLSAMGAGSLWSKRFVDPARGFVVVQLALGVCGGFSGLLLFAAYVVLPWHVPVLYACVGIVGALVGCEIPLLARMLQPPRSSLEVPREVPGRSPEVPGRQASSAGGPAGAGDVGTAVANLLAADYLGALVASLLFPLVLSPLLGPVRTTLCFGLLNVLTAAGAQRVRELGVRRSRRLRLVTFAAAVALALGLAAAGRTTSWLEDAMYQDDIVFATTTPYQRLVLTRWHDDARLFLNGQLQFSTRDEARYHEALVHPALHAVAAPRSVLVLGGGDGMAVREVLKHPSVTEVVLVDIDPEMTRLFRDRADLAALNAGALRDPRVTVVNDDALSWARAARRTFDVVIMDLPDPSGPAVAKLYTASTFRLLASRVAPAGAFVTQATSPYYAPEAYWCIVATLRAAAGWTVQPYHLNVPSFGEWGFALATTGPWQPPAELRVPTRALTPAVLAAMFALPKDLAELPVQVNRADDPILVRYYDSGWRTYFN